MTKMKMLDWLRRLTTWPFLGLTERVGALLVAEVRPGVETVFGTTQPRSYEVA